MEPNELSEKIISKVLRFLTKYSRKDFEVVSIATQDFQILKQRQYTLKIASKEGEELLLLFTEKL